MSIQTPRDELLVDCSIRVPGNAEGSLADAAAAVLERVDGVREVASLRVTGIRPRSNAVVVDAEAEVHSADLDPPDAALADRLDAAVGVDLTAVEA